MMTNRPKIVINPDLKYSPPLFSWDRMSPNPEKHE